MTIILTPDFEVLQPDVKEASTELAAPADKVASLFAPFQKPFEAAAALLNEEDEATTADKARALRLKMVKARTAITATKDESKSDIKLAGNIIDWFHNKGRNRLVSAESRLREIEEAEERKESARKEALKVSRTQELSAYGIDCQFYQLGEMPDEGYSQLLESSKVAHAAKLAAEAKALEDARIAAEKAEAERVAKEKAEAEDRARIEAENARLKAEAEANEKALASERAEAKKALLAAEAKAKAEREAIEAKAKDEREKLEAEARAEQAKAEAAAKVERDSREKAEAEANALRDAEAKRIADEAAAKAKAAKAPEKQKLKSFAAIVRELKPESLTSPEGKAIAEEIASQVEKFAAWIEKKAESL